MISDSKKNVTLRLSKRNFGVKGVKGLSMEL